MPACLNLPMPRLQSDILKVLGHCQYGLTVVDVLKILRFRMNFAVLFEIH
jgi:hypothetical protein